MTKNYKKNGESKSQFYLECSDCSKFFKTKSDCDKHKLSNNCSNNNITLVSYFTCSKCNQIFHKDDDCFSHIQICSKNNSITTNECHTCKKRFSSKYSCERHINGKKCRSLYTKLDFFQCYNCLLKFKNKYAIIKHFKRKVCTNVKHSKCFVQNCNVYFRKREQLIDHLIIAHKNDYTFEGSHLNWDNIEVENLTFTNENEFQYWLEIISKDYNCNYFCSTNKLVKNSIIYKNFRCQYDKRLYPNKLNSSQHKRTSNPNLFCPSRVCTKIIEGKILVTYYKTHNHQLLPNKRKSLNYSRYSTNQSVENMNTMDNNEDDDDVFIENENYYFNMDYKHGVNMHENVEENIIIQNEFVIDSTMQGNNEILDLNNMDNIITDENESHTKKGTVYFETNNENPLQITDYKNIIKTNYDNGIEDSIDSNQRGNVIISHDSQQVEPQISFDIDSEEDNTIKVEANLIKLNRHLNPVKSDIGQLVSSILKYVKSSESVDFLNKMKENLEHILETCEQNLSSSIDEEQNCFDYNADTSIKIKNEREKNQEGGGARVNVKGNDKPKYFDFTNFHVLINTVNNINLPQ